MSKWEDKYNEFKSNIDNMIQEQSSKMDELRRKQAEIGKDTESKDYKDLKAELKQANAEKKKLEQLKPNLGKISNVIEFRETLKEQLDELKKEVEFRKEMGEATKKKEELETEISNYQERHEKIAKELRSGKLSDSEKEKLEKEKTEISEKMSKAQEEWDKQDGILRDGLDRKGDLSNLAQEEIDNKLKETQTKISKCNLVAKNLLEGKSWDDIGLKLDNWKDRTFTNKGEKISDKDKPKTEPEGINLEGVGQGELEDIDIDELSKKIVKRAEFEAKHPRLAKIANWFSKVFNKDKMLPEPKKLENEEVELENQEEKEPTEVSFKEYIKQIAEKGMDGIAAEEKAARQAAAKEKLAKMREANRAAEAHKFGQDYADKSDFRPKDNEQER